MLILKAAGQDLNYCRTTCKLLFWACIATGLILNSSTDEVDLLDYNITVVGRVLGPILRPSAVYSNDKLAKSSDKLTSEL